MKYFGTDGIRGIVNENLTASLAYKLGLSLANYFNTGKVVIGRDNRVSSSMLISAISAGLLDGGIDVTLVDIVSSPALSFITKNNNFDFGVMITAYHNPPIYNGIKIFNKEGEKLSEDIEERIESLIDSSSLKKKHALKLGELTNSKSYVKNYIDNLVSISKKEISKYKICVDCANGATSNIIKKLVKKLNLNATVINTKKDGKYINDSCGATNLKNLQEFIRDKNFDAAFSFDGDGDRIMVIDNKGKICDGDDILYSLSINNYVKRKEGSNSIVVTHFSNFGLDASLKRKNIKVIRVEPGDSKVYEKLKEQKLILGGERSGHIVHANYIPSGDGVFVMLKLLNLMATSNLTLSEIILNFKKYYLVEKNIEATKEQKEKIFNDIGFKKFLFSCDEILVKDGRMLVRPSGTENLIRVLVENVKENKAKKIATIICDYINKFIANC